MNALDKMTNTIRRGDPFYGVTLKLCLLSDTTSDSVTSPNKLRTATFYPPRSPWIGYGWLWSWTGPADPIPVHMGFAFWSRERHAGLLTPIGVNLMVGLVAYLRACRLARRWLTRTNISKDIEAIKSGRSQP